MWGLYQHKLSFGGEWLELSGAHERVLDANRYLSHYSRSFRSEHRDFATWSARKRQVNTGKTWIKVGVNDVSVFEYPGKRDLMMISFEQDYRSNNLSNRTFKRQFWAREDGHWRIVHEAVVGS